MNKSFIRKKLLKLRKKNFPKNYILCPKKFSNFLRKKGLRFKNIGGYYPFNYELDVLNLLIALEKKNFSISLPKISKNNEMNFFKWSKNDPLKINKYGIPEPISNNKIYPNILLIPLLGFDDQYNRIGYGGGYYDRYLSKVKKKDGLLKIGVGFSFQKVKSVPVDEYDEKLDFVITDKMIAK